jgi:hypothetical protein
LPKFIEDGDTASCATAGVFPDRDTVALEFAASDSMERLPLAGPPDFGAKLTVRVILCPAAIVSGRLGAGLRLKPLPVTLS